MAALFASLRLLGNYTPRLQEGNGNSYPGILEQTTQISSHLAPAPLDPTEKSDGAIAALLNFINAGDNQIRCHYVIGKFALTEAMGEYYGRSSSKLPERLINPSVTAVETASREIVVVSFVDELGKPRAAAFEWDGDAYRMHWEAFVGYGGIFLPEFFSSKPQGEFQVRANLYLPLEIPAIAAGSKDLIALLSHPDLPSPSLVRVPYGSNAFQQLSGFPTETDIPALVGIRWPENGDNRIPILSRWIHRDWIAP